MTKPSMGGKWKMHIPISHLWKFLPNGFHCYYKFGQLLLQIGTACIITNPDNYYKSGQLLQIGAEQDGTKIIISDINLF